MKNKIIEKRLALTEELAKLDYQLKHRQQFFSRAQVRCWRVRRRTVYNALFALPTDAQLQQGAKRINYSNSSKIKSRKHEVPKMPGLWSDV